MMIEGKGILRLGLLGAMGTKANPALQGRQHELEAFTEISMTSEGAMSTFS